jgi:hypothetical protein
MYYHKIKHPDFCFLTLDILYLFIKTHLIDSSKTCLSPSCVNEEHSIYLNPFNSAHKLSPRALVVGACRFAFNCSSTVTSVRVSSLVPTNINGVPGAWCCNRKAEYKNVSQWIGQRSQPVIVLLACCVPLNTVQEK